MLNSEKLPTSAYYQHFQGDNNAHFAKRLASQTVLIDAWYAAMKVMKAIKALDKVYYAPVKRNRLFSTSVETPYQRIETLT